MTNVNPTVNNEELLSLTSLQRQVDELTEQLKKLASHVEYELDTSTECEGQGEFSYDFDEQSDNHESTTATEPASEEASQPAPEVADVALQEDVPTFHLKETQEDMNVTAEEPPQEQSPLQGDKVHVEEGQKYLLASTEPSDEPSSEITLEPLNSDEDMYSPEVTASPSISSTDEEEGINLPLVKEEVSAPQLRAFGDEEDLANEGRTSEPTEDDTSIEVPSLQFNRPQKKGFEPTRHSGVKMYGQKS